MGHRIAVSLWDGGGWLDLVHKSGGRHRTFHNGRRGGFMPLTFLQEHVAQMQKGNLTVWIFFFVFKYLKSYDESTAKNWSYSCFDPLEEFGQFKLAFRSPQMCEVSKKMAYPFYRQIYYSSAIMNNYLLRCEKQPVFIPFSHLMHKWNQTNINVHNHYTCKPFIYSTCKYVTHLQM